MDEILEILERTQGKCEEIALMLDKKRGRVKGGDQKLRMTMSSWATIPHQLGQIRKER